MSTRRVENLVYKMLTENTGSNMLDSGGAYGRHHERNRKKTLKQFKAEPEAWAYLSNRDGSLEISATINVFHYLAKHLDLDDTCDQFNRKKVRDWKAEELYGVSFENEAWLKDRFSIGDTKNTYNWGNNLSQTLQYVELEHLESGDTYILLQVHGGCDIRGGYTDAKLFKLGAEYFGSEDAFFEDFDLRGEELVCHDRGNRLTDEALKAILKKYKIKEGFKNEKKVEGDIYVIGQ